MVNLYTQLILASLSAKNKLAPVRPRNIRKGSRNFLFFPATRFCGVHAFWFFGETRIAFYIPGTSFLEHTTCFCTHAIPISGKSELMTHEKLDAFILSGGLSTRFGQDKARFECSGKPLLVRLSESVRPDVRSVSAIGQSDDQYADLGIKTFGDIIAKQGPLGGLHRALQVESSQNWILLLSCDMLNWHSSWLNRLSSAVHEDCDIVAFREAISGNNFQWQPFPGLYRTTLITMIESMLDQGKRSLMQLFQLSSVRVKSVSFTGLPSLASANTREEFDLWQATNQ